MKPSIAVGLTVFLLLACGIMCRNAFRSDPATGPTTRIDDLSVPAAEILALSPDVAKIDVLVPASRPTHRIIQIADFHLSRRSDYRRLWHIPSEEGYSEFVTRIEELQARQVQLLCWLVDEHGLTEVFEEGLYEEALPGIDQKLAWVREWDASRAEVSALAARLRTEIDDREEQGEDATALRERLREAEEYTEGGLIHRAVRRLLISRPAVRLLPAEDKECYEARRLDDAGLELREDAIVQNLLSRSSCAVIVLGAGHDLAEQVTRLGRGRCEYVRVVPAGFSECINSVGGVEKWPMLRDVMDAQ